MKIWCILKRNTAIKWRELLESQHEDLVHSQKEHCHKMARIARCGVDFPLACVANSILGENPELFPP
jgi:hypothetical protein